MAARELEEIFSFGEWVRRRRRILDLTQAELAQHVRCAAITIRKIEADALRPSRQIAERLASCLAIPPEQNGIFLQAARAERAVDRLSSPTALPQTAPSAAAPINRRTNLPTQLTSFVGREHELAALAQLLTTRRLVTLTGGGGVGKTRLALQAASSVRDGFPDGAHLVELAPLRDAGFLPQALGAALGIREEAGQLPLTTLNTALRDRQLLLVLDNCEHLLAECAAFVDTVLRACAHLHILATSREPLNLLGEQLYPIRPLPVPTARVFHKIDDLVKVESVQLFCDRARMIHPTFAPTAENTPAIVAICQRLDGLPLAIELAAARIRLAAPDVLLEQLRKPLAVLVGGPRNLPARQQTLRDTIGWSYQLLDPHEQRLFQRLGIFVGGWTVEAAEAICDGAGDLGPTLEAGLTSLLDKSLLRQIDGIAGVHRFAMLETIHSYALEQLTASEEIEVLHQRHAAYYLALVEQAEENLYGPQASAWMDRIDQEHENLRAVLGWALEQEHTTPARFEIALRLCAVLWRFWWTRGFLSEGRRWLDLALARQEQIPPQIRAKLLYGSGVLARVQGDRSTAATSIAASLALWKEQNDKPGIAQALNSLGVIAFTQREYDRAGAFFAESRDLYQELDDAKHVAMALNNLGNIAYKQDDLPRASELYEEGLLLLQGDPAYKQTIALIKTNLGEIAKLHKNYAVAAILLHEGAATYLELNEVEGILYCLNNLAEIAIAQLRWEQAAHLLGAADALYERTGAARSPDQTAEYEQQVAAIHSQLGDDTTLHAWSKGRLSTIDQLLTQAIGIVTKETS